MEKQQIAERSEPVKPARRAFTDVGGDIPISIHTLEWAADGPPCFLIHGIGDAACVWSEFAQNISREYRTVACDMRGHGHSDHDPSGHYSTGKFVDDLREVIERHRLHNPVLIGHSFGGEVAIHLAQQLAPAIRALVLVDAGPNLRQSAKTHLHESMQASRRAFAAPQDYAAWLSQERPLSQPHLISEFAAYNTRRLANGTVEVRTDPTIASLLHRSDRFDLHENASPWSKLRSLQCPVLAIRGGSSSFLSEAAFQDMVASDHPSIVSATIQGSGHAVMLDRPTELSRIVRDFFKELPKRDQTEG